MAGLITRGDIWIVNLEPVFGREIHKKRPALIISNNAVNQDTYHVVVVPGSSIAPISQTADMVYLGKVKGFKEESILLPVLIRSIDQDRLIKKIGKISQQKLLEVEEAIKLVLGFDVIT
ncbi:type II toxin-antitoxin system PemK/MazF family toxin [Candidatus Gottesmanbacteria bacterium]|nr:type II toxin-antitoxin system PemK/MazF family toxin [Candidatus Gottesmanbacteria bacterium]